MANLPLPPLKMDLAPAVRPSSSAVAKVDDAVITAAETGAKPRLVGRSTISTIDDITPGMGNVVKTKGLKGIVGLVQKNPKKAAAIATVTALGSVVGYGELEELASSHPVDEIRDFFANILSGVDDIEAQAGLNSLTPNEDEDIAGIGVNDVASHFALVKAAQERHDAAAAAMGGANRLYALMGWLSVDDDLKAIVIQNAAE